MPASAEIIPFPSRPPAPAPLPVRAPGGDITADGAERLRRALAMLDQALSAQRDAIGTWREELALLRGSVVGLDRSLRGYHANLAELRARTGALHGEAQRLEAWADAALPPAPLSRAGLP
jgi:hypothetical protein